MFDIFGEYHPVVIIKTPEEEYLEYINSAAWRHKRKAKLESIGWHCERCLLSRYSVKLDVHHKTYEHFKNEPLEDLEVVCKDCHQKADLERLEKTIAEAILKSHSSPLVMGFEAWMDRSHNADIWRGWNDSILEYKFMEFLGYVYNQTGRNYDAKYRRHPDWN